MTFLSPGFQTDLLSPSRKLIDRFPLETLTYNPRFAPVWLRKHEGANAVWTADF